MRRTMWRLVRRLDQWFYDYTGRSLRRQAAHQLKRDQRDEIRRLRERVFELETDPARHRPCHHCECPELHSSEELKGTQHEGRQTEARRRS